EVVHATEPPAEGVKLVGRILGAATNARWPMYLRNVKQILKAADRAFDERRYGFSGLIDLLRACQRDGLVRLERDRRGGLRVFQGPALRSTVPAIESGEQQPIAAAEGSADVLGAGFNESADTDVDGNVGAPIPVDATAELLG